jgi:DNA-binding transcriptional LysR family regulator
MTEESMIRNISDMDVKLLRLFAAVARCGGFTAAQAELDMSHSNISMQISTLEKRLGYRICERGKSGFHLTEKGKKILDGASKVFESLDEFKGLAQGLTGQLVGDIYIGLADNISTLPAAKIQEAIRKFYKRSHSVHLHIYINSPAELEVAIIDKQLDIAISYFNRSLPSLTYKPLYTEKIGVVCGNKHPLHSRNSITVSDLESADWIKYGFLSQDLEKLLKPSNFTATAYHLEGVAHAVLAGTHLGYLPIHYANTWIDKGEMKFLILDSVFEEVEHGMLYHNTSPHSEAVLAFIEDLLSVHGKI